MYLVKFVQKKTDYLRSLLWSDQNSEQIYLVTFVEKKSRLYKVTLYRSDQDSDLSGNIYSKENRLSKITLYRSYQDSEQISSDLSGNIWKQII